MKDRLSPLQMQKLQDALSIHTYTCECGHRVVILPHKEKEICNWCKHYVFKNKKDEFKYRTKEMMRRI